MHDISNNELAMVSYNLDPDFKDYVDKYAKKHDLTADQAFEHAIVKLYYEYVKKHDDEEAAKLGGFGIDA